MKYASALRLRIEDANGEDSDELKAQADAARSWLEDLDLNTANLDEVRLTMTEQIRTLDQGLRTISAAPPTD